MINKYGERLDSNGYSKSIVQPRRQEECFLCHRNGELARHEIFFGAFRKKSKELGLWVYLCPGCHQGTNGVHGKNGRESDLWLKKCGQIAAENEYGFSKLEFIAEFGRNYLD